VKRLRAVQPGVLGGDTGRIRVTQQVPHGPHDADDCHATAQRWSRNCTVGAAGDVGAAAGCWRCDLSEYCHVICHGSARATTAGCWLAGSAPSKSSAQVDGAAPPPAMMISPGWAGSRGRDRDRKSARRRRELVASVHARSCMSCRRGGGAQRVPSGLCGRHCAHV
jgi:hypothetical protein